MDAIKVYSSGMNREEKPAKCVLLGNRCEVVSNDGQMKIILLKRKVFGQSVEEYYVTDYYIREDDGWIITNTENSYKGVDDFIATLAETEEFSQAVQEYYTFNN